MNALTLLRCAPPLTLALLACSSSQQSGPGAASPDQTAAEVSGPGDSGPEAVPSLAQKYRDLFSIGAAVDPTSVDTHAELLKRHFSSITTENEMKFESLQPKEGEFHFGPADEMVAFAQANGMKVRGHALVWHRQTPAWVFQGEDGQPASEELLFERMRKHISTVVGHYRGKVYAWDVVNEAVMNDGAFRTATEEEEDQQSPWYGIAEERYIAEAFRAAHEADPDAKLFYNDYYNYLPEKRESIVRLLQGLLKEGVPVHGVGLQAHIAIERSTVADSHGIHQGIEELEAAIQAYADLGLDVQVTELDVSLYIPGNKYEPAQFYTAETFGEELQQKQAKRYGELFAMLRKHADAISGVTFWGIADDNTWLSEFTSKRTDFPLLFDQQHQPKPAFHAVMDF